MPIPYRQDPEVLVVTPGQKVTASDGNEELSRIVQASLETGIRKVLFDFSNVEYIDSLGVGQIVTCYTSAKNKGGHLILCGLKPRIVLVLKMASLHLILDMRETGPEDLVWPA